MLTPHYGRASRGQPVGTYKWRYRLERESNWVFFDTVGHYTQIISREFPISKIIYEIGHKWSFSRCVFEAFDECNGKIRDFEFAGHMCY